MVLNKEFLVKVELGPYIEESFWADCYGYKNSFRFFYRDAFCANAYVYDDKVLVRHRDCYNYYLDGYLDMEEVEKKVLSRMEEDIQESIALLKQAGFIVVKGLLDD